MFSCDTQNNAHHHAGTGEGMLQCALEAQRRPPRATGPQTNADPSLSEGYNNQPAKFDFLAFPVPFSRKRFIVHAGSPENFCGFFLFESTWEFCIEKWQGFLVNLFCSPFPTKRSTKTPQTFRGKFGANPGQNSGRKFEKFGELSFCNFSDLTLCMLGLARVWFSPASPPNLAKTFARYRGHLGPPGKVTERVRMSLRFRLRFGLFGPPRPRGPGNSFRTLLATLGPKGPNDPCSRARESQSKLQK